LADDTAGLSQDVEADEEAAQEEPQSFTMMDLQEFMRDEMFTAVIEKEFLEGEGHSNCLHGPHNISRR
jgi:hypothetical protein